MRMMPPDHKVFYDSRDEAVEAGLIIALLLMEKTQLCSSNGWAVSLL